MRGTGGTWGKMGNIMGEPEKCGAPRDKWRGMEGKCTECSDCVTVPNFPMFPEGDVNLALPTTAFLRFGIPGSTMKEWRKCKVSVGIRPTGCLRGLSVAHVAGKVQLAVRCHNEDPHGTGEELWHSDEDLSRMTAGCMAALPRNIGATRIGWRSFWGYAAVRSTSA